MTKSNKLIKSLFLTAGFAGAIASANAATITVDFDTGVPNANAQAWGSSLTAGLGTNSGSSSRYVSSDPITAAVGDTIDGSGSWYHNGVCQASCRKV